MIPHQNPWQQSLYDWLGARTAEDFACGLPGLTYDEGFFTSDDDIYRTWTTFENLGREITKTNGFRIAPEHFTLEQIERPDGVYMKLYAVVEPACLAWLYSWEYGGNPYHESEEIANRALAACMVDMMMAYDKSIGAGNFDYFSQTYGSAFATWAYVLHVCRLQLPVDVVGAYEEGLMAFYDAFQDQGPTGIQADMDLIALVGMWYAAPSDPRTEQYARTFLESHFHEAGYIDHGGGFDASYNGISIKYLTWFAHASGYDFARDALSKMANLKAHLSFPDSGGVYGPSHFATATDGGSPADQHWSFGRDVAVSYIAEAGAYLRYGFRNIDAWKKPFGLVDVDTMLADIEAWTMRANDTEGQWSDPLSGVWTREETQYLPELWSPSQHLGVPGLAWDYYPEDFYERVVTEANYLAHLPVQDERNGIWQFGDDFVVWSFGGTGGAIHTGGLSWYPDRENGGLCGLSGGALSALWFDGLGLGILGRSSGSQGSATPDTWENVDGWLVQHVWGHAEGMDYSTAREKGQEVDVVADNENFMVKIVSDAVDGDGDAIIGAKRVFDADAKGVQVSVEVTSAFTEFDYLYETIPLWYGAGYGATLTDAEKYPPVQAKVGGNWQDLGAEPVDAHEVKLERAGRLMLITFEKPVPVHLGPVWNSTYQDERVRGVPLHVDILAEGSVRYTISGPYKHDLRKA